MHLTGVPWNQWKVGPSEWTGSSRTGTPFLSRPTTLKRTERPHSYPPPSPSYPDRHPSEQDVSDLDGSVHPTLLQDPFIQPQLQPCQSTLSPLSSPTAQFITHGPGGRCLSGVKRGAFGKTRRSTNPKTLFHQDY